MTMENKKSTDYHDYFIKDGRFIGAFEEMYQNTPDPWHIQSLGRRLDMDAALLLIRQSGRQFRSILDVGCGKGLFTSLLADVVPGQIRACDVSETAIDQAGKLYPHPRIEFFVWDANRIHELSDPDGSYDLIVLAQTIWCVLPNFPTILKKFHALLQEDGSLLISQHFLPHGKQQYGRDMISNPEDLMRILAETGFDLKATLETDRFRNHHLALRAEPAIDQKRNG
jgi:SAM-dependent methyltransferase